MRFIDLPQAIQLAREPEEAEQPEEAPAEPMGGDEAMNSAAAPEAPADEQEQAPASPREDPLALLAEAAGYDDHELWWERQIEQRRDMVGFFDGILEAMTALRADTTPRDEEEAQREAHMRQGIRAAQQEGFKRIAVVCGAWHAPALGDLSDTKADAALLKGLKRIKTQATWIPWTNSRLAYRSGYGAGVTSPGWYEHLWTTGDRRADALADPRGAPAARRGAGRLLGQRDRGGAAGRGAGGDARSADAGAGRDARGDADRPLQRRRRAHDADPREARDRRGDGRGPAGDARRAAAARPGGAAATAAPPGDDRRSNSTTSTCATRTTARAASCCTGCGCSASRGASRNATSGQPGTFHEYWRVKWQLEFVVGLIEANVWGNTVETRRDREVASTPPTRAKTCPR